MDDVRLVLDQGLPRHAAELLSKWGVECVHVADLGLSGASDQVIMEAARRSGRVVATLDSDFHALLAESGASGPSVVRIRLEGLKAKPLAELVIAVLSQAREALVAGAAVTVTSDRIRIRWLPIVRS